MDHDLQKDSSEFLGNKKGCIIVMDAYSGKIRAMVSKPTFNPSEPYLSETWGDLTEREDSPFLSRATAGLYAPGSTWKIVTSAAIIENGYEEEMVLDEGKIILGGREYKNSKEKEYGEIGLDVAFPESSNVYFAKLGSIMGKKGLSVYKNFLLGESLSFDIPIADSLLMDKVSSMSEADIASTSIGQGKLMVSPFYMCMVASSIANKGEMVMPYMVEKAGRGPVISYEGKRNVVANPIKGETADKIAELMALCVEEGTGAGAKVPGLSVYGKTGTAQNETEKSHDWFLGFAENDEGEKTVICVMLEYNGVGSSEAASMAGRVLSYWPG
jgi:peptidoglycan glycosyltransferase